MWVIGLSCRGCLSPHLHTQPSISTSEDLRIFVSYVESWPGIGSLLSLLKLSQLWPLGALLMGSYAPWTPHRPHSLPHPHTACASSLSAWSPASSHWRA